MKKNLIIVSSKNIKSSSNTTRRLNNPVQLSFEDNVLKTRKATVLNPFSFNTPKKIAKQISQAGSIQHFSVKGSKGNVFKLQNLMQKNDLINFTPDSGVVNKPGLRSVSPKTLKSSLKTQIISHKNLKRVKFEDMDEEIRNLKLDSLAKRTFQNFKVSIRQSPTYFSPKEPKKSPRYTVKDLINQA